MMAHVTPQIQHRFLARLLSPEETLEVLKHLRECETCREELSTLRSSKPGSLVHTVLPEMPEHPSGDSLAAYLDDDLNHTDKAELERHLQHCELCREALADLEAFREELLQAPRREYTEATSSRRLVGEPSPSRPKWGRFADKRPFISWFNQPLILAGAAAVSAVIVVLAVVFARSPERFGIARARSGPQITIVDGDHLTLLGLNGLVHPPAALSKDELTELNALAGRVWQHEPPVLSPAVNDSLAGLKRIPSVLLGEPAGAPPFQVVSPVRTLVKSIHPTFKWTLAPAATSYTVHIIIDDRTQEEVATSPSVVAPKGSVTTCQWSMPESISLARGKRYRWYVSEVSSDQEIDAPGIEEPQAKFAVLNEADLARLESLKEESAHDRLLDGLLNLNAGLLDDAQNDFQLLSDDPNQAASAKDFLNQMIVQIRRIKEISR